MAKTSPVESRATASTDEAVDPRVLVSRERVLSTTLDLLTGAGLDELTIDEISRRSGVAKTTIYRHWPNRSALVIDACSQMTKGEEAPPDTGSLDGDLRAILANIAELLGTARWSSIVPSIVDAAEHDPAFADIHATIQRGHAAPLRSALDQAARRGEIPSTADRDAITASLLGPLFYRRWFSREPIDSAFVEVVIHNAVASLQQDTRRRGSKPARSSARGQNGATIPPPRSAP